MPPDKLETFHSCCGAHQLAQNRQLLEQLLWREEGTSQAGSDGLIGCSRDVTLMLDECCLKTAGVRRQSALVIRGESAQRCVNRRRPRQLELEALACVTVCLAADLLVQELAQLREICSRRTKQHRALLLLLEIDVCTCEVLVLRCAGVHFHQFVAHGAIQVAHLCKLLDRFECCSQLPQAVVAQRMIVHVEVMLCAVLTESRHRTLW